MLGWGVITRHATWCTVKRQGSQKQQNHSEAPFHTHGNEMKSLRCPTLCSYPLSSVQFSRSVVSDSETPWIAACLASLSITNSQSLLKLRSIESVMPSKHLILCHPLLLLPSILTSIRVFSNESFSNLHMRWPKYWSFPFSISPSSEHPGLISFRTDWLAVLAAVYYISVFHSDLLHSVLS